MEGIIINYRRGRKTQTTNQMVIMIPGNDVKKSEKLVGKEVVFTCEGKNNTQIKGKITSTHGNSGAVRALFEKGMPGQAIGQKIEVKN